MAIFHLYCLGRQKLQMPRRKNAETAETTANPATDSMTETTEKKVAAKTSKKGTPVSAAVLLETVAQMEGQPADKIAHACGYFTETTVTATGETDVRVTNADQHAFMAALVAAQGISIAPPVRTNRRSSRLPIIKIGKNGAIVVGGRYTTVAGFPFGENMDSRVRIEAEAGKITITAAHPDEYAGSDDIDDLDDADDDGSELDI